VLLIDDSATDLSFVRSLDQLEVLLLWGDGFSPAEVARLRLALPKCVVKTLEPNERAICTFWGVCGGDC
jgi:hypothetical protein